jgi:hypothetical protein
MYGYDSDEKPPQYYSDNPLNKIKMMCDGGIFESYPGIQIWHVGFMDGTYQEYYGYNHLCGLKKIEGQTEEDQKAILDFCSIIEDKEKRDKIKNIHEKIKLFSENINHIKFKKQLQCVPKYETTNNDNIIRSINFCNCGGNYDDQEIIGVYGFRVKFNNIQKNDFIIYCNSSKYIKLTKEELRRRINFYDNILTELPTSLITINDYVCYFKKVMIKFDKVRGGMEGSSDKKFRELMFLICYRYIPELDDESKEILLLILRDDYLRLFEIIKNKKKIDECHDKIYNCENVYGDLIYEIQSNFLNYKPSFYHKLTEDEKNDIEKYFSNFTTKFDEYYKILDEPIIDHELIPYIENVKIKIIDWKMTLREQMKYIYVMPNQYVYESIDETNKIKKINCEFIEIREHPDNNADIYHITTIEFNDGCAKKYYNIKNSVLNKHYRLYSNESTITDLFRTDLSSNDIIELEKLFETIQNHMNDFQLKYSFHMLAFFLLEKEKID